jgi:hypothetical protein
MHATVLFWQAALPEIVTQVTTAEPLSQIEKPLNLSLYVHIWIYRKTEGSLYIYRETEGSLYRPLYPEDYPTP